MLLFLYTLQTVELLGVQGSHLDMATDCEDPEKVH